MLPTINVDERKNILLNNLQANILKPHGQEHCWCFFIRFKGDSEVIRNRISFYANEVTSTIEQLDSYMAWKKVKTHTNIINDLAEELEIEKKIIEDLKNEFKRYITEKRAPVPDNNDIWGKIKNVLPDEKFVNEILDKLKETFKITSHIDLRKIFLEQFHEYNSGYSEYYKNFGEKVNVNFCLSATGYKKLKISHRNVPKDLSFQGGMKGSLAQNTLLDTIEKDWEKDYMDEIDAVVIVAHNSEERLRKSERIIKDILLAAGDIIKVEKGNVIRNQGGRSIEHFGFVDGISNTKFFDENDEGNLELLTDQLKHVLVKDSSFGYGSYFAFRKLEQNVKAFNKMVNDLVDKLKISKDQVGQQIIGRDKNGAPLPESISRDEFDNFDPNNTDHLDIFEGCPFHSHIIKVNPRSSDESLRFAKSYGGKYGGDLDDFDNYKTVVEKNRENVRKLEKRLCDKIIKANKNHNLIPIKKLFYDIRDYLKSYFDLLNERDHKDAKRVLQDKINLTGKRLFEPEITQVDANIDKEIERIRKWVSEFKSIGIAMGLTDKDLEEYFLEIIDQAYSEDQLIRRNRINISVLRRGYTYDYIGRDSELEDEPEKDVGILFMSYQASIQKQFERIINWCNSKTVPYVYPDGTEAGIDPLIGKLRESSHYNTMQQQWKNNGGFDHYSFHGAVTCKGGEYFFAPSIAFLKNLMNL